MLKRTVTALLTAFIMAASLVNVAAQAIPQRGNAEIIPNRLTVRWEDESRDPVTINTFRIFGFNVAQLRTMVHVLDGTVANLADGSFQIGDTGASAGHQQITFHERRNVEYIINHTRIRNHLGALVNPIQPGWVFLPQFEYNWASVRDVINALGLTLIDVNDDPAAGHTEVIVRRPSDEVVRPPSGPAVNPPGRGSGWRDGWRGPTPFGTPTPTPPLYGTPTPTPPLYGTPTPPSTPTPTPIPRPCECPDCECDDCDCTGLCDCEVVGDCDCTGICDCPGECDCGDNCPCLECECGDDCTCHEVCPCCACQNCDCELPCTCGVNVGCDNDDCVCDDCDGDCTCETPIPPGCCDSCEDCDGDCGCAPAPPCNCLDACECEVCDCDDCYLRCRACDCDDCICGEVCPCCDCLECDCDLPCDCFAHDAACECVECLEVRLNNILDGFEDFDELLEDLEALAAVISRAIARLPVNSPERTALQLLLNRVNRYIDEAEEALETDEAVQEAIDTADDVLDEIAAFITAPTMPASNAVTSAGALMTEIQDLISTSPAGLIAQARALLSDAAGNEFIDADDIADALEDLDDRLNALRAQVVPLLTSMAARAQADTTDPVVRAAARATIEEAIALFAGDTLRITQLNQLLTTLPPLP